MKLLGTLATALFIVGLVLATPAPLSAVFTQCPPVGLAKGCNVLITINPTGCPTVVLDTSQTAFDGGDDSTVGVQNNSGAPLTSLALSGTGVNGIPIFELEGDGACSGGYSPNPPAGQCTGTVTTYDPKGIGVSFTIGTTASATVNFSPSIPAAGSSWFSVEDAFGPGGLVTVNGCQATIVGNGGVCPAHAHSHTSTGSPGHFGTISNPHEHHAQHGTHLVTNTCPVHVFGHILLSPDPNEGVMPAQPESPVFTGFLNQENKTGPAARGSVVQLFGSAEGIYVGDEDVVSATDFTPPASGSPLYTVDGVPEIQVGGRPAKVIFSGLAPGKTGVWQINFEVPADSPVGKVPVTVSLNGQNLNSIDIEVRKQKRK